MLLQTLNRFLYWFDLKLQKVETNTSSVVKLNNKKLSSGSNYIGSLSSFRFKMNDDGNCTYTANGVSFPSYGGLTVYVFENNVYKTNVSGSIAYIIGKKTVICNGGIYPITVNTYYKIKTDGTVGIA